MPAVRIVKEPSQVAALAAPIRQRILEAMQEPGSATTVARRLGLSRQKVAYHVRQLEEHGYLHLVAEEQKRGCTERILQRSAQYLVASNEVFGRMGLDARRVQDKFSSEYLMALAAQVAREVGEARGAAERAGKPLATLSTEVEIRLRSPREREAFAAELVETIARLAAKYHDENHPDGRTYRLVVGAYPIRGKKP
jgi:DNA-binding transcriptional ArsR family regulator